VIRIVRYVEEGHTRGKVVITVWVWVGEPTARSAAVHPLLRQLAVGCRRPTVLRSASNSGRRFTHRAARSTFQHSFEPKEDARPVWAAAVMPNLGPPAPWHLNHQLKRRLGK